VETIARIVTRCREFERLYLQGMKLELELMLEEALTRLYAEILTNLARAVRFFGEKSMGEFQFSTLSISSRVFAAKKGYLYERIGSGFYYGDFTISSAHTYRSVIRDSATMMN
jgi:hypothetical protein